MVAGDSNVGEYGTGDGGDGYEAFGAAEKVTLRADDDAQITYERAFREFLESFAAGAPVVSTTWATIRVPPCSAKNWGR